MNDDNSVQCGRSGDDTIVYIALQKSDKNLSRLKFRALDNAWRASARRLFEDSKARISISYASIPMFPESETSHYNAVMKRIRIPENDHSLAQQVNQEIETVSKINNDDSVQHGTSPDNTIVYIALKNDKDVFAGGKGNEMSVGWLRQEPLQKLKLKYSKL